MWLFHFVTNCIKPSVDKLNTAVRKACSSYRFLFCFPHLILLSVPLTLVFRHLFFLISLPYPLFSHLFSISNFPFPLSLPLSVFPPPSPHFLTINNFIQEETGILAPRLCTSLDPGLRGGWRGPQSQSIRSCFNMGGVGHRHT